MAKMIGVQGMQDIGYQFAYHAQQLMSRDAYVKAMGSWPEKIVQQLGVENERARVTPNDIRISYDLLVRDGSIPGGNFSDQWIQLYKIIVENPALAQRFDLFRYFEYIAVNLGAKNIDDFRAKPTQMSTMPDEQVAAQVQQGNMIPVGGMNGVR